MPLSRATLCAIALLLTEPVYWDIFNLPPAPDDGA